MMVPLRVGLAWLVAATSYGAQASFAGEWDDANWLNRSPSAFVQGHAGSKVQWRPWAQQTLDHARKTGKPIYLHIGNAHHGLAQAMQRDSFASEEVVALLHEAFVPVLVDRFTEPDIAAYFADLARTQLRVEGWPLNLWATPEGDVFDAAGYLPASDEWGGRGFPTTLNAVVRRWNESREAVLQMARAHREGYEALTRSQSARLDPDDLVNRALDELQSMQLPDAPGFGLSLPASELAFLARAARARDAAGRETAQRLFHRIFEPLLSSGLKDHVGGGFFTGATSEEWDLPVFQKILADQVVMIRVLALETGDSPEMESELRRLIAALVRDFQDQDGGFITAWSSTSEDLNREEKPDGAFYLMTEPEIREALPEAEADLIIALFGIQPEGNISESADPLGDYRGLNLLRRTPDEAAIHRQPGLEPSQVDEILNRALDRLVRHRHTAKTAPDRNQNRIVEWNAHAVVALAEAGVAIGCEETLALAVNTYKAIAPAISVEGADTRRLIDSNGPTSPPASVSDLAAWGRASVALYEATGETSYLETAVGVADSLHGNMKHGVIVRRVPLLSGYVTTVHEQELPGVTAVAIELFEKLVSHGQQSYAPTVDRLRRNIHSLAAIDPLTCLHYIAALARLP